jgi:dihydrofolate reductase
VALTHYYTASTLDGFIADDQDSLQWLFDTAGGEDPGVDTGWREFLDGVGALAMGSTTWEWIVDHEDLPRHPERWSAAHGERPCWVFSSRERTVVPGLDVRFVSGDVRPVHGEMRAAAAERDVWVVGGGDLAGQFHDAGLLDRVTVGVAPVTLGSGAPLLPRRIEGLLLVDVRRSGPMVSMTYDVPRG